nr:unnamed protein product [Callosobruchus chinensis]
MLHAPNSAIIVMTLCSVSRVSAAPQMGYDDNYNPFVKQYTRNVTLKQGMLQGVIYDLHFSSGDVRPTPVEVYRGIPYAAAPVGNLRFMPTRQAPSWSQTEPKLFNKFGPVCPQRFPDISRMTEMRRQQFERLQSHLMNQSEDCLYLNIYAPYQGNMLSI